MHTIGSGPPALLWHSLFVDSTTWIRVQQPLSGMRQLIQIDGPAHCHNPPAPTRFTLQDCVGVAVDVMDYLGIQEPVDWLGNAWGGHVGVLFAAAHSDRVRSLTAIGAPIHALSPADRRQVLLLRWLYRLAGPVPPLVNLLVDALLGPRARAEDPAGAALVADAFRRADRRGMAAAIGWLSLARPDLTPVLDRLRSRACSPPASTIPCGPLTAPAPPPPTSPTAPWSSSRAQATSVPSSRPPPPWSSWSAPSGATQPRPSPASAPPRHPRPAHRWPERVP